MTEEEKAIQHQLNIHRQRLAGIRRPQTQGLDSDQKVNITSGASVLFFTNEIPSSIRYGRLDSDTPGVFIRVDRLGHEVRVATTTNVCLRDSSIMVVDRGILFTERAYLKKLI